MYHTLSQLLLKKKQSVTNKAVIKSDSAVEIGSVLVDLIGCSFQRVSENPKYKKDFLLKDHMLGFGPQL